MRLILAISILTAACFAQAPSEQIPADDAVRIHEFYRLASQIQDQIWPHWSQTPTPVLLVTPNTEYLTHHPAPPADFKKLRDEFYSRPRQFSPNLLATMPVFGPPSTIVVGEPKNTGSKTSTPWLITLMHEHFHQLQSAQPGYYMAVEALGLSRGDKTGMWMLNYPFPYTKPEVTQGFAQLRDLLLTALNENDEAKFSRLARQYVTVRKKFFEQLTPDDRKYLGFQLWQEGIARYTEIRVAEAAAKYQPTTEYAALADFETLNRYAPKPREKALDELKYVDLGRSGRLAVYPFGAAEGFLLDRMNPVWRESYFKHMLSTDSFFEK